MADLARPAHVGDVQETVDPFFDLDERAVVGEVADGALDRGTGRVLLGDQVPGVGLGLLHPQADLALLLVDPQDDDLDLVAGLRDLAGVVDPPGPAHLGDVDQPLDARLELDEGAVAHHVDDLAGDPGADGVLLGDLFPGVGRQLLQAQGDLAPFLVDVEDHDLDLVVDPEPLAGVLEPLPAHVGDVQEAVDAAEVDERAEVGEVLDRAGPDLADGDLGHELLAEGDALGLDQAATREDDVPPVLVDREDDAADLAVEVIGDVRRPSDVDLAGGKEGVDADVDQQPALDLAGDLAGDDVPFAVLGDDALPGAHPVGLLARENHLAGLVVHALEQDFDLVARLGGFLPIFPLVERDEPFGLVTDVDDHLVADDLDDPAWNDAAGLNPPAVAEEVVHVELLGVHIGDVEFAKQVSIYHKRMSVRSV